MKILVHLLSEQAAPNAIACALLKPDRVVCLDSGRYTDQARRLEAVSGLPHALEPMEPYDLEAGVRTVLALLERHAADEVWLNFTGGTKMMALAAVVPATLKPNCHCVYVDTARRRLVQVDRGLHGIPLDLGDPGLSVADLVALAGEELIPDPGQDDLAPRWPLTHALSRNAAAWPLTQAAAALLPRQRGEHPPPAGTVDRPGVHADWNAADLRVEFRPRQGAPRAFTVTHPRPLTYLAGGWREEFVAGSLVRAGAFREVCRNLAIRWSAGTLRRQPPGFEEKNELDVAAVFGWRPVIIECKSGWYNADTLHKLKFLRDHLFGDFGVAVLATGSRPTPEIHEKARDQGIHLVADHQLRSIAQHVVACAKSDQPLAFTE